MITSYEKNILDRNRIMTLTIGFCFQMIVGFTIQMIVMMQTNLPNYARECLRWHILFKIYLMNLYLGGCSMNELGGNLFGSNGIIVNIPL